MQSNQGLCKDAKFVKLNETTNPLDTVVLGSEVCEPYFVLGQPEVLAWAFQQNLNNGQSTTLPGARHVERNLVPRLSRRKKKGFFFINSTIGRHYFTTRALSHSFSDHCFTLNNGSFLPNFEFKQNTMTFTVTWIIFTTIHLCTNIICFWRKNEG